MTDTTTIYFLRHAEVYNPQHIVYGRLPRFKISAKGRADIEAIVNYFKNKKITKIYVSPMLRTRQTGEILGKTLGLKPTISNLLNEVKLIFQGSNIDEFRRKFQGTLYSEKNLKHGQESIKSMSRRMLKFLRIILKKHKGEKIIVVSHGDPILILRAVTSGEKFTWGYKKNNYLSTGRWFILDYHENNIVWS